jgi:hypothetical protein
MIQPRLIYPSGSKKNDDFLKNLSAGLRFIFIPFGVRQERFIPNASCGLHLEHFTVPSNFWFL